MARVTTAAALHNFYGPSHTTQQAQRHLEAVQKLWRGRVALMMPELTPSQHTNMRFCYPSHTLAERLSHACDYAVCPFCHARRVERAWLHLQATMEPGDRLVCGRGSVLAPPGDLAVWLSATHDSVVGSRSVFKKAAGARWGGLVPFMDTAVYEFAWCVWWPRDAPSRKLLYAIADTKWLWSQSKWTVHATDSCTQTELAQHVAQTMAYPAQLLQAPVENVARLIAATRVAGRRMFATFGKGRDARIRNDAG